jgi:hypothetical protein
MCPCIPGRRECHIRLLWNLCGSDLGARPLGRPMNGMHAFLACMHALMQLLNMPCTVQCVSYGLREKIEGRWDIA